MSIKIIAIIPARGGSKGIPRKNLKKLAGKPLIVYSIEAAQKSLCIDDVVITTDDNEIAAIGKKEGAEIIKRPVDLAGDRSLVMDAVRHVMAEKAKRGYEYNLLVLLEPTAPFRTADDIDSTIELLISQQADSAATFSETKTPLTRMWKIEKKVPAPFIKDSNPFLPRQQQQKGYTLNGMVYALKTSMLQQFPQATSFLLGKKIAYMTPAERAIDIDSNHDFLLAEFLINKQNKI